MTSSHLERGLSEQAVRLAWRLTAWQYNRGHTTHKVSMKRLLQNAAKLCTVRSFTGAAQVNCTVNSLNKHNNISARHVYNSPCDNAHTQRTRTSRALPRLRLRHGDHRERFSPQLGTVRARLHKPGVHHEAHACHVRVSNSQVSRSQHAELKADRGCVPQCVPRMRVVGMC